MRIESFSYFLLGEAIVGAAFFAEVIGLDNDLSWGKVPFDTLVFGILTITCGVFYSLYTDTASSVSRKIQFYITQL